MSVSGVEFLAALLALSAFYFYLPTAGARRWVLTLCNAGFLYLLVPNGATWVALAVFLLSGYLAGTYLNKHPQRWVLGLYLTLLLAAFVWLKKYDVLGWIIPQHLLEHPFAVAGLSYILFRQIHFVVDAMQGQLEGMTLWTYLNYQLNFFTLLSGPIQRYQDFKADWETLTPVTRDRHDLLKAYQRIFLGLIKITLLSTACLAAYSQSMDNLQRSVAGIIPMTRLYGLRNFGTAFYMYPAYVYFNFSGYCDIVIGGGVLLGLRLPENFNRPYLSRNVIDFWTRLHMTLGNWIRDYLFTPMYKAIAERSPERAPQLAFLCYFVALTLAGIWHGSTLNFLIYGLLQGIGVSAAKLWEMYLIKTRGRQGFKAYMQSERTRRVAIVCTFHFACLSYLFFTPDVRNKLQVIATVAKAII